MAKPVVIIPAAGSSSRFFPLELEHHKSLTTLHGQSLLTKMLGDLENHGFERVVIVVPNTAEQELIEAHHLPGDAKLEISFTVLEKPTGMGDALLTTRSLVSGQTAVASPYQTNAGSLLTRMLERNEDTVVCHSTTDQPWNYGIVTISDEKVTGVVEKPEKGTEPSNLKLESIYLLSAEFMTQLEASEPGHYNFESTLNTYAKKASVGAVALEEPLTSLKYPWHLFDFQSSYFAEMTSDWSLAGVAETARIDDSKGPVYIGAGSTISNFATIVGPCYIGNNVFVGDYSLVRNSSIEADVTIGAYTEVVRSIIQPKSTIHSSYLADSILGKQVKIGAGFISANKRLDREAVRTKVGSELISTQRNSLGCTVGPHTQFGIRCSTMPGVLLGSHNVIDPNTSISKNTTHDQS